jgi:hypothetical protein
MNNLAQKIIDLGVDAQSHKYTKRSLKGGHKYGVQLIAPVTSWTLTSALGRIKHRIPADRTSEQIRRRLLRMWSLLENHVAQLPEKETLVRNEWHCKRVHFVTPEALLAFVGAISKQDRQMFILEFWTPKLDVPEYNDGVLTVSGVFHKPRTPTAFYVESDYGLYDVELLKRVHAFCTGSGVWMNNAMKNWQSGRDWGWRKTVGRAEKYLVPAFGFNTITEACMLQLMEPRLVKRIYQNSAYKPVNTIVEEIANEQDQDTVSN